MPATTIVRDAPLGGREAEVMEERARICPYCAETINAGASVCKWCDRLLQDDRPCPFCCEPILTTAVKCRYCGSLVTEKALARQKPKSEGEGRPVDRTIHASPIGAFLYTMSLTAILYPPELHVSNEQIRLRRWTLFGLRVFDQKVSTRKVASVRFHKGIIWASVTLETHGGAMADLTVPALDIDEAQQIVNTIEEVIQHHQQDDEDGSFS